MWEGFTPSMIPQFATPVIEQFANRSMFTDRPLIPKYLQDMIPKYQSNPYTTDTARLIGGALAKIPGLSDKSITSPIIVENYIRAWTGGLGQHALNASDKVLQGIGVVPSKVEPKLTAADKPLIKAFAVRFPEAGANSVQDFYEEFQKRQKAAKTIKYLQRSGAPEDAQQLRSESVMFIGDGIQKAMSNQLKMVRDVWRNKTMTPQQKRDYIDMAYFQVIKMAKTGNALFAQTKEDAKPKVGWSTPVDNQ